MAEIQVQRKVTSAWPYVVAILIAVALLAWFMWSDNSDGNMTAANTDDASFAAVEPIREPVTTTLGTSASTASNTSGGTIAGIIAGPAVSDYLEFVDVPTAQSMNVSHDYTAGGLQQLAAALREVANGSSSVATVALQPRIDEIQERADALQRNENSFEHALQVREAFAVAAGLIGQMTAGDESVDVNNLSTLQNAATAIDPEEPLLNQASQIEQFFAQAGEAIRDMTDPQT